MDYCKVDSGVTTMDMNGMFPLRLWQIGFRYPVPYASGQTFSRYHCRHLVLDGAVAEDFAVEDGGENREKGGEERCRLEELGLAGEVVGAEALVEALVGALVEVGVEACLGGVIPMLGVGPRMVCLMVTHTMAMA